MIITKYLQDSTQTEQFGAKLHDILPEKGLVFLQGDLGAGKTTLVRGFLRAAGHQGTVKSPTFTLVEEYHLKTRTVFHFDLYRLNDAQELEWIGMSDYLSQNALCFIEWAELGDGFLPQADIVIQLNVMGLQRLLTLESNNIAVLALSDIEHN